MWRFTILRAFSIPRSANPSSGAKVLKLSKKIITTFYALYRLNKREIVVRIGLFLYLYPPK